MTTWLGLTWPDWLVLGFYLVGVTVLGLLASRKVHDTSDYFMGGRRFGKIFMMFFAFGAGTSTEQANSVVAGTWRVGLAGIWWQFLWLFSTPFYWLIAPILRRMRALTTSDFFEARYDRSTAMLYSVWGIVMAIVFIAGSLFGSGKMIDALTGGQLSTVAEESFLAEYQFIPVVEFEPFSVAWRAINGYEIAILAITVLFVAYGMAGGLGAAIWTDFIQGVLTITFSFLLLPFVIWQIGGWSQLNPPGAELVKPGMFDLMATADVARALGEEPITLAYVLMLSLTALAGIVVQPHIMGVCGAGKTEFEGRFGFTFGNFIKRFCTIAWTFTALACLVWYLGADSPLRTSDPQTYDRLVLAASGDTAGLSAAKQAELEKFNKEFADRLFGRAAYDILPTILPGLVGLLLASLLAAMMSTCDAQMIVGSGLFTENLYKPLFKSKASQRHYLWVGRFAGLGIVLCALVFQTTFTDVIAALKVIVKTPAVIGISLWVGVAWRGWTPAAVWASSFAAAGAWAFCAFRPDLISQFAELKFMTRTASNNAIVVSDLWQMIIYMSVGVTVGVLVSLVTPRTPKEKLDRFFRLMRTPVRRDEVVHAACTLPDDAAEPVAKLINHPDFELPRPTLVDLGGFAAAWVMVGLIIWLTRWLAG